MSYQQAEIAYIDIRVADSNWLTLKLLVNKYIVTWLKHYDQFYTPYVTLPF